MPDPVIVEGVRKAFGGVAAVDGIDLEVAPGEFLSLLGPSGCGKTTLLRIIAGFERADAGRIVVGGADVTALPPNRRPLNMVFQRYALFPHLTVEDNIAFGLRLRRLPGAQVGARVREMLELVQLPHTARRFPHQISGGQAQRVALARALANDPEVLLLDEPLTALDRAVRADLQEQLKLIQHELGTTFVYVTHDQGEAMAMSTRIALMRDGRIVQLASPGELYRRPDSTFAAGFVGDANLLHCRVERHEGRLCVAWQGTALAGAVVNGAREGAELRAMLRPEDVRLQPSGAAALAGTVLASTFYGFYWMHRVRVGEQQLSVREIAEMPSVRVDDDVGVTIDGARAVLLDD